MKHFMRQLLSMMIGLLFSTLVWAAPNQAALQAAWQAADKAAQKGPSTAAIAGQATLNIPANYYFVPKMQANALMKAMGNSESPELYGLIVPNDEKDNALFTVEYQADGYVKDNEAKDLNPDDILQSYKEGTEQANEERVKQGYPALEVTGWAQKPVYDAASHRLTWAMLGHDKGAGTADDDGVNYETRILGREGVISITMLVNAKELSASQAKADALTTGLQYNEGKKYENFSASAGDKVAEYGLAALITGAVAKKLGLFAVILAFVAKFAKLGLIAVFAAFPFLKRMFKRKEKPEATATVAPQAADPVMPATPTTTAATQTTATSEAAKLSELTDTTKL